MLKLSYIIPFYNGQTTIRHCLESIYALPLAEDELEVIVVDDCSPVSAERVLSSCAAQHPNLRILRHETNKRQGGAKNTGIRAAKGEYIAFADQDDEIIPQATAKALQLASANSTDMLSCHYTIQYENGSRKEFGIKNNTIAGRTISGKTFCEQYFQTGVNLAPWAYLYRREFLLQVAHPYAENVVMEDSDWIAWHLIRANKITYLNQSIYVWIMNGNSITHSRHYINKADWIKYGYRKVHDAQLNRHLSDRFADTMTADGMNNMESGIRKLWKVDNYRMFFRHLGEPLLHKLQQLPFSKQTLFVLRHPMLTCCCLYLISPLTKSAYYIKQHLNRLKR